MKAAAFTALVLIAGMSAAGCRREVPHEYPMKLGAPLPGARA